MGNLLRQVRVANLAQRDGINQIDMPRYKGGKSLLGSAPCILPHEVHVIGHHFLSIHPRRLSKVTILFHQLLDILARRAFWFRLGASAVAEKGMGGSACAKALRRSGRQQGSAIL